jgi:hypothetical protein
MVGGLNAEAPLAQPPASRIGDGLGARAHRTIGGVPRRSLEGDERMHRRAEIPARRIGSIHQSADGHDLSSTLLHEVYDLARRATGRHDILDDQDPLPRLDIETASEGHLVIYALAEDEAHVRCEGRSETKDDRAHRRGSHHVEAPGEVRCEGGTQPSGHDGVFEDPELLGEEVGVPARRQLEVAVLHRTVILEQSEDFCFVQPLISFSIAAAAEAGSSAPVIGLPTTIRSAPASIASRGPMVRRWSPRSAP